MGPYISPGMTATVRRLFEGGLQHTYTRVPYSYAAADGWTNVVGSPGADDDDRPCRYLPKPLINQLDTGRDTLVVPSVTDDTLLVPWDDDLVVGDHVMAIRALPVDGEDEGRLLYSGEALVVAEADHAGLGPVTLRRFILRAPSEAEVPVG